MFSCEICEIFKKIFLKNVCQRLFLIIDHSLKFSMKCFLQEDVQKELVAYLYATNVFDKWILKLLFDFATTKMFTFSKRSIYNTHWHNKNQNLNRKSEKFIPIKCFVLEVP